ncbi:MAG: hypothetical protein M0R73_12205 [Dehalococcoidia bacterium]|nr:hypothetical protein [Dehalococcoidia bacterium]
MTLLQLRSEDARVVYLATIYHLGRPGSETDPDTLQRHDLGLRPIHDELVPRLNQAVVEIDASPYQVVRLGEALLGLVNELKQFALSNGHSMVPRFSETVREFYPETADDPGAAMDLVQHPVMLRNRMSYALEQAQADVDRAREEAEVERKSRPRWWQFWKR